jgi:hypothetical protein
VTSGGEQARLDREGARQEFTAAEIAVLAEAFPPIRTARSLLREAGFPMTEMPGAPETAAGFWEQVSESLANGALPGGRGRILIAASRRFPGQPAFTVAAAHPSVAVADRCVAVADDTVAAVDDKVRALRVLVVGASPSGTGRIRPDREARAIEAAGNHLLVRYCPAAAATDLRHALEFQPDILHLACHGRGTDLVFEDTFGAEHAVPARDVAGTLRLYRDLGKVRLRGLVLGSCDSELIAADFAGVAERVVAHSGPLDDECAVVFAGHLYAALAHTADLGAAARLAAQHTLLTDQSCAAPMACMLVLPAGG